MSADHDMLGRNTTGKPHEESYRISMFGSHSLEAWLRSMVSVLHKASPDFNPDFVAVSMSCTLLCSQLVHAWPRMNLHLYTRWWCSSCLEAIAPVVLCSEEMKNQSLTFEELALLLAACKKALTGCKAVVLWHHHFMQALRDQKRSTDITACATDSPMT